MKRAAVALLLVSVVSGACGENDAPTAPTPVTRNFETWVEGSIPGQSSHCQDFRSDESGPAYANVGLAVSIEIGTGGCAGTRTVVARSDTGEVSATLPAGLNFVRFEHTGTGRLNFRLVLRYLLRV